MKKVLALSLCLIGFYAGFAQSVRRTQNVVVVTIDGCRWQDVYRGADSSMLFGKTFMKANAALLSKKYWANTVAERRAKVMPFFWSTVQKDGQLYGNRDKGSVVSVKNPYNLSYPGYSEIFTGFADTTIKTNDLLINPNPNVLEFIAHQPGFVGKVASYGSWDRFPYILNEERSGFPVNGGYEAIAGKDLSVTQQTLNTMQELAPRTVSQSSRPDYVTYFMAKEYVRLNHPRVLSLSLAYTDDMAHDGNYGFYLDHINAIDQYLADLWKTLQADPFYKDKTTMLITVDHGRGEGPEWTSHGAKIAHSNEIWFAVMGPDTKPGGEMKTKTELYQNQFAQTVASFLGLTYTSKNPTGSAIEGVK